MKMQRKISQAIAVLEAERFSIGEDVADTTIAVLEERLATLLVSQEATPEEPRELRRRQGVTVRARLPFVGRSGELRILQNGLHQAMKTGKGATIVIRGDAGVGKSRLVREFVNWTNTVPENILVMKGRGDPHIGRHPFALIGDLLGRAMGIQDTDDEDAIKEKLANGLSETVRAKMALSPIQTLLLGTLFGLSAPTLELENSTGSEAFDRREGLAQTVIGLMEAAAAAHPAVLLILEDTQWADKESLDLVKRLAGVCGRLPLLLIHLVRSERSSSLKLAGREPVDSETRQADLVSRHIDLGSLSDEDCHRMLTDVDLPAPEMPERLRGRWREFVVEHCAGSPLKAENLIGILVGSDLGESDDHKVPGELQSSHQLRVSTTLWGLLQARLDTLLKVERIALQRAAVMGNAFWPDALRHIALRDGENPSVDEIATVLRSLERKGLIRRQGFSRFANSTEYVFESAVMQAVSYESILPRIHPGYHRQAAGWLARNSRRLPAGRNALIADHYEKAEDPIFAAELYEMAATRAQETYDLSLAIDHTCKALSILIDEHQHTSWQLRLQVALGDMLSQQARLVEAAQTYLTMEYIAQEDGDLTAQARALNGSALVQRDQAAYKLMLQSAEQAVPIARLAGDDEELVTALLLKSEAHFLMGDSSSAVRNVMRALERSRMSRNEEQFTVSLSRLFRIHERLGESKEARRFLRLLQQQVRHLNTVAFYDGQSFQQEEEPTKEIAALGKVCLGKAYQTLGLYDKADAQFEAALDIYRSTNANSGVASTLALLGETAQLAADVPKATSLFRQALAIAAMIGDERGALRYRTGLGESLIREGSFQAAVDALERVIQSAEDDARMSNWEGLPRAYCHLAQAQAGLMHSSTALDAALYGLELAVQSKTALQHARAWRILGEVAAMPGQRDPISVADTAYDAVDCFSESLHILRRSENRSVDVYRARLATLLAWSEYEQNRGNQEKAEALRNESSTIEQALFDWTNALVA